MSHGTSRRGGRAEHPPRDAEPSRHATDIAIWLADREEQERKMNSKTTIADKADAGYKTRGVDIRRSLHFPMAGRK